jgi:hypothetical protein
VLQLLSWMVIFVEINVFLQLSWIGLYGSNKPHLHLQHLSFRKYSFKNICRFTQGNCMLDNPASKTHGFFRETQVFLQLRWMSLLEATWDFLHLENYDCKNYSLQNELSLHEEKMCSVLLLLTDMVLFQKILLFCKFSWIVQFGANRAYFHPDTPK